MAYNNKFFYSRSSSIDSKYKYVLDLSEFKPIYGSSVLFKSRLNFSQTYDNSLRASPSSENNITTLFKLIFLLNDDDCGRLLKTIEVAGGYKFLKFIDPSNMYMDIICQVENYNVEKNSKNLNLVKIDCYNYINNPTFFWKTSSYLKLISANLDFNESISYKKYSFVYKEGLVKETPIWKAKNKMNNFWFAKTDLTPKEFSESDWSKNFIYENHLPINIGNAFDVAKLEYRNSFIENVNFKENYNSLKTFQLKYENIDDHQCKSMLFFLEKKIGYKRFIYDFPIFFKKDKVFICIEWEHTFKYYNCNDIALNFIEDPNPPVYVDQNDTSRTFLNFQ